MLKARLAEKRALKAEEEKKELIVKEKVRRSTGREIQEAKEKQLEIEMAKALKDKKQEKIDDLKAHNKIKAQIEQDKLDRQRKREELKSGAPPPVIQKAPVSVVVGAEGYKTCRIQLRIADQPNVLLNLNADAFFEDVYNEAVKVVQGNLEFVSTFPKRVYGVKDLKKSLLELGLVPSCSLIVQSVV